MKLIETLAGESEAEVICRREGSAGVIVLNRPKALNAISQGMVDAITAALEEWRGDTAVTRVLVAGAGGKAFCAGGDIRSIHQAGTAGRPMEPLRFWREEYLLNIMIKRFPKPYVALINGIVMGGGVGLSLHGSHRVAGERYLFAMPEVGIGFFPDVGATWALPRLPGEAGTWLALTGARIKAADSLLLGLASHVTATERFDEIIDGLIAGGDVDEVLAAHSTDPGPSPYARDRAVIDECFAADHVAEVLGRLDRAGEGGSVFAQEAARTMRTKSPLSMAIALRQMRLGRTLGFEPAMALEFRIVSRMLDNPDFYEGVRAVVIDKDQNPRWSPATIEAVSAAQVDRFFAPLDGGELVAQAADLP